MIDIHCHILPGIDDGSENMSVSLEMAYDAAASGVDIIVATPHCNLPFSEEKNYVSLKLRDSFLEFREAVKKENLPLTVLSGAEVFATPDLPQLLDKHKLLTLAGSRYLLVEFYFNENPAFMEQTFTAITERGLIPVIAHPERYEAVQHAPGLTDDWFGKGYILQLNKGSILGKLGRPAEKASLWMLDHGLVHAVASDAHGQFQRRTDMAVIKDFLSQEFSPECADLLLNVNPRRLLEDKPAVKA